jgi:HlyD family secretion protein
MKRTYLYGIIAIVVLGTAGYFLLWNSNGKDVKYRTETTSKGSIVVQVRATGTINPVQTVAVGSQVSGIIEKINVDFNSQVRKGEIIAVLDSTNLFASVKEAEANLERTRAQLNESERTQKRTTELFKKNLVSQADLDAAQSAYEQAAAQLKQTQAALDRALVSLRYAIIRSPIDGVVISRDVDVGQTVAASLQTPKLFGIANDLKRMQVEASVDEADIGQIKDGQMVTFTVDAYTEEQFTGTVSQVRLAPVTVQNVVTYTVIIDVPNPEMKLRPGMTATVSILVNKHDDILRVPALAVRFLPPQDILDKYKESRAQADESRKPSQDERERKGQDSFRMGGANHGAQAEGMRKAGGMGVKTATLWVLGNGKDLKPVDVTIGISDNRYVEILSGSLKEGDEVIVGTVASEMSSTSNAQTNPFGPRPMMGGPGPGRGGR